MAGVDPAIDSQMLALSGPVLHRPHRLIACSSAPAQAI
jgi:hypothetical protein